MKESLHYEAKEASKGTPRSIWETYSAFCNTDGGVIQLGVSEDPGNQSLKYTGVKNSERMIRNIWSTLNDPSKVSINLLKDSDIRTENVDGAEIITITVPRASRKDRPVYINGNLNSGTYKRNCEGDYHCTADEIREMISDAGRRTADSKALKEYTMECIDYGTVNRYRGFLRSYRSGHPWCEKEDNEFLELIGAAELTDGRYVPTLAGLLMFGKLMCIKREVPDYILDYTERNSDRRYDYRFQSNTGMWSGNVFDFLIEVSARLSNVIGSGFGLNGFSNVGESPSYICARELIINALTHADYSGRMGIRMSLEGSVLTVSNPGCMRIPIEEALRGGSSDPRNSTMMSMLNFIGFVENMGSGLRSVMDEKKKGNIYRFEISESFEPSRVTAVLGMNMSGGSRLEDSILTMMKEDPSISLRTISRTTGEPMSKVVSTVNGLREKKRVSRKGKTRGEWIIG